MTKKCTSTSDPGLRQMQAGVDALTEGFALFDARDELIFCNAAFRDLYPDLANFLVPGTSWSVFLLEARRRHNTAELEQLDAHLASGIDAPLILEGCQRGARWLRMALHPAEGGGFVLTEADMTDQQQATDIIEHADDLLRDILDACASRIVLSRITDGSILYRTPAWKSTFGPITKIQETFRDSVSYSDLLTDILPTGRLDDFECLLARTGGQRFPARLSARLIDYQGESAVVISTEDMSQIYRQRDEIISINQRLLDAIEALDQGFVLFDKEHRLLLANQRYLDINHVIADTLVPGTPNTSIVERSLQIGHQPLAAGWPDATDESVSALYEFELNDGRTFSVSRRATSDGGFVIAWRDISEQKSTEQELLRRREEAFQNEKLSALGQLLAGVAHELNNPLSVVVGHAMMLRDEVKDPDALDGIDKISRSAERCAKIVKTFLAMARQRPAELEYANLNDIISSSLEIASYGLGNQGIQIEVKLAQGLPLVELDETQVGQVIINLAINAEHALAGQSGSPRFLVSTNYEEATGFLVARFSDNGTGIPQHIRHKIFEPFFTTKDVDIGTGVGLALSHRIISSHGGRLELVDSEIGGATFEIRLPAATELKPAVMKSAASVPDVRLKALLVEDEPDVADVYRKLLSSVDVTAHIVPNAEAGLKVLESDSDFDLVLSDLRMPGMSGRDMLAMIEKRWPQLSPRFVFITGDAISEDAEAIHLRGTHRLIEKPVSPADIRSLVQSIAKPSNYDNCQDEVP